ncbi:MAG: cob(I)yrinic acid a,c-diamide adenosyltransferase [Candidatus Eremiobacterota bacterium]
MKKQLSSGLVQIYTGDGKGKTTAALGQALRATGHGFTVRFIQFLKCLDSGELHSAEKLHPSFVIYRFEHQKKFFWTLNDEEKKELKKEISIAMDFARKTIDKEECNILVLDEILGALQNKLVSLEEIKELIERKPYHMELILTGRNAPEELVLMADLVTEMKKIKHPADRKISSREGIEL